MRPASRVKPGMTVRKLLKDVMTELERSTADVAEVVEVPVHYMTDLMSGRRRPPLPSRTDIYDKMTRYLRLGRTDLAECANAERQKAGPDMGSPDPDVRREMLELCDADTVRQLEKRSRKDSDVEMVKILTRVLEVVQGTARRSLEDQIPLRIAATRTGENYLDVRLRVLEFLDTSPATLTSTDLTNFVRPQVAQWDVDLETGVLRVVLRSAGSTERHQRRPMVRTGRARLAG